MIRKTKEGFLVKCDVCGYEEIVDTHDDMFVFKEMLKETGWISKHRYKNVCADCGGSK